MHTFHTCRAELAEFAVLAELKTRRFVILNISILVSDLQACSRGLRRFSGRRDASAAEMVRRKEGLVDRYGMSMRSKGEIIGKVGGKNFRFRMREMGWARVKQGIDTEMERSQLEAGVGRWVAGIWASWRPDRESHPSAMKLRKDGYPLEWLGRDRGQAPNRSSFAGDVHLACTSKPIEC
jgi:hypothetical protein